VIVNESATVLGLHIASEVLWLAGTTGDGGLVDQEPDRLQFKGGGPSEDLALAELEETLESIFRRVKPEVVALLKAGSSKKAPAPTRTQRRAWIESGVMIACARTSTELKWVTHNRVEEILGLRPTADDFSKLMATRLSGPPPPKWSQRSAAFSAALAALGAE
jgi:hypothetical protein